MMMLDSGYTVCGNVGYIGNYDVKIEKTIIRGQRKVKQLVGIKKGKYDFPQLDYIEKNYPSHRTLQEFDGELLIQPETFRVSCFDSNESIIIKVNELLEKVRVISQYLTENNILTVVVDKVIEEENIENKFNYNEIMDLYSQEVDKYWKEFLKRYENDTTKTALIKMYDQNDMNLEDIVDIIEKDNNETFKMEYESTWVSGTLSTLSKNIHDRYRSRCCES